MRSSSSNSSSDQSLSTLHELCKDKVESLLVSGGGGAPPRRLLLLPATDAGRLRLWLPVPEPSSSSSMTFSSSLTLKVSPPRMIVRSTGARSESWACSVRNCLLAGLRTLLAAALNPRTPLGSGCCFGAAAAACLTTAAKPSPPPMLLPAKREPDEVHGERLLEYWLICRLRERSWVLILSIIFYTISEGRELSDPEGIKLGCNGNSTFRMR